MEQKDEPMESDFFDFATAFGDLNAKLEELSEAIQQLVDEAKKKKKEYPYPYPYPYPKKKKMSDDEEGDGEGEEDEEKKEMAKRIEELEAEKKNELLEEFAKLQGNEKLKEEVADFSIDQLKKLISLSKAKEVNFGKTVKGPETTKDYSKEIAALETKIKDFQAAGLEMSAKEAQEELERLKKLQHGK